MSKDDETEVAIHDAVVSPEPSDDPPALRKDTAPVPVEPRMLVEAFRHLQQRIPDYSQLSVAEQRALMRVAYLDPEFIDAGILGAGAWDKAKAAIGWTEEELRGEVDAIREWDDAAQELRVLLKGIDDATLKRKHRLGQAILLLYGMFNTLDRGHSAERTHLRPYLEEMKRAYARRRKKKAGKAAAEKKPDKPEE